jgi:hypothetical protein
VALGALHAPSTHYFWGGPIPGLPCVEDGWVVNVTVLQRGSPLALLAVLPQGVFRVSQGLPEPVLGLIIAGQPEETSSNMGSGTEVAYPCATRG